MDETAAFQKRIKIMVDQAGGQRALARLVGKTNATINGWLAGSIPYDATFQQIAEKTGMSVEWLRFGLGDEDTEIGNLRRTISRSISGVSDERLQEIPDAFIPAARLQNYVAASMLTYEEVAKRVHVPAPDLELMLKGKKQIDKAVLNKAKQLAANPPHTHPKAVARFTVKDEPVVTKIRKIPIIGWAAAGTLTDYADIVEWEDVLTTEINDPKAIAIRIRGDSMSPNFPEGTIAVVTPSFKACHEQLVIARMKDDGVVFKRLHVVNVKQKLFRLLSINPKYDPIERHEEEFLWIYPVKQTVQIHD